MEEIGKNLSHGQMVGDKFQLIEQIGRGSFGMIWRCINIDSKEPYAIKYEKRQTKQTSMLVREIKVLLEMKEFEGFARLISYGKDDEHNYIIMTFMGRNMDTVFKKCQTKFSIQTLCNISIQMITRIEMLHSKNLIHRDVKPDNFVVGYGEFCNIVNLIDFGLAKFYKDSEGKHIPFIKKKGMIGTARYASINAHLGHEQSRRDDIEGLGYVLLYFAKGKLPWQNIHADTKEEKYEKIKNMKQTMKLEQLCEGAPSEFIIFFEHIKSLEFTDEPDYKTLKQLFNKILIDRNEKPIDFLDWQNLPEYKKYKKIKNIAQISQNNVVNINNLKEQIQMQKEQKIEQLKKDQQIINKQAENSNLFKNNIQVIDKIEAQNQQINNNNNNINKMQSEQKKTANNINGQVYGQINISADQRHINLIKNFNYNDNQNQINIKKAEQYQNNNDQQKPQASDNLQQNIKDYNLTTRKEDKKKLSAPINPNNITVPKKQRDSFLSPTNNILKIPNNQQSTITAITNFTMQENSQNTSKINAFDYSNFSECEIGNDTPALNILMQNQLQINDPKDLKKDIRRKSQQLSLNDLQKLKQTQNNMVKNQSINGNNNYSNNNNYNPVNINIIKNNFSQNQQQQKQNKYNNFNKSSQNSSFQENIQEEGVLGSDLGENVTNPDPTSLKERHIIQILNIQHSYKNTDID